jgi:glutamine amidotransferase
MNVLVLDLGLGNIRSLTSALTFLGARHEVSADPAACAGASHLILPGVGAFDAAMTKIKEIGLAAPLLHEVRDNRKPLLGVCLGMQLLCEGSDEGVLPGLGLMPGHFRKLEADAGLRRKVPHVGFSAIRGYQHTGLFQGLEEPAHFYFTHSFALSPDGLDCNVGLCDHAKPFVAAFQRENICGAQFHPEKSQAAGLRLLSNFLELK